MGVWPINNRMFPVSSNAVCAYWGMGCAVASLCPVYHAPLHSVFHTPIIHVIADCSIPVQAVLVICIESLGRHHYLACQGQTTGCRHEGRISYYQWVPPVLSFLCPVQTWYLGSELVDFPYNSPCVIHGISVLYRLGHWKEAIADYVRRRGATSLQLIRKH